MLAADLVNADGPLADVEALRAFLDKHLVEPRLPATPADLDAVRALRSGPAPPLRDTGLHSGLR